VTKVNTGIYNVKFNKSVEACAWQSAIGSPTSGFSFGFIGTELLTGTTDTLRVYTASTAAAAADRSFHIAAFCPTS
jgi:hypothetical protein